MSWFRRDNITKLPPPEKKLRIPEGLFHKCDQCEAITPRQDYVANFSCCTNCGAHGRIDSSHRLGYLLDPGSFEEHDAGLSSRDPLEFTDKKKYRDRVKEYQKASRLVDAVRSGVGAVDGITVSIAVMDFDFVGGSMGSVVGEKITRAIERGLERNIPVIVISTSGGARMQEGVLSLMQMAKTSAALARLGEARIPYVSILTHPTTAGVMASYASLGDVIIAEPDALIGFAGPRVIEQTINQILPKGFQRSAFVQEHGFIDIVCPRWEMRDRLANLLRVLRPAEERTAAGGRAVAGGKPAARPPLRATGLSAAAVAAEDLLDATDPIALPAAAEEVVAGRSEATPAHAAPAPRANGRRKAGTTAPEERDRARGSAGNGEADLHAVPVGGGAPAGSRSTGGTRRKTRPAK